MGFEGGRVVSGLFYIQIVTVIMVLGLLTRMERWYFL